MNKIPALPGLSRRHFLQNSSLLAAGALLAGRQSWVNAAEEPGKKLVVGVMGLGRGLDHVRALLTLPNVEVAYLCDVDEKRRASALKFLNGKLPKAPQAVGDFRRILEDRAVDVLFIATPNFWHASATILACAAGKHVYVEKPGSGSAWEGEQMVAAARKHKRVVQQGMQRRSWPGIAEAVEKLRSGVIGKLTFARSWYNNTRQTIGKGQPAPVPAGLDYTLWQGPLPERPYVDNLVHYNWHWRWYCGNGELGNNGIHALDLARWGLGVDYPKRVTYNGGRYHFEDDQQTPDTGVATYDFGGQGISWEHSSCQPRKADGTFPFVVWYGTKGTLALEGDGFKVYDLNGKLVDSKVGGTGGDAVHVGNFLNSIRQGTRPSAEIEEGQKSTLLCHLGNIAYRTGRTVNFDPATRQIVNDPEATKLWRREFRPGWELPV